MLCHAGLQPGILCLASLSGCRHLQKTLAPCHRTAQLLLVRLPATVCRTPCYPGTQMNIRQPAPVDFALLACKKRSRACQYSHPAEMRQKRKVCSPEQPGRSPPPPPTSHHLPNPCPPHPATIPVKLWRSSRSLGRPGTIGQDSAPQQTSPHLHHMIPLLLRMSPIPQHPPDYQRQPGVQPQLASCPQHGG